MKGVSGKGLKILPGENASCSAAPTVHSTTANDLHAESAFQGRAAVVTLGCAKNQVDSEVMLGSLRASGFEIVSDISRADVAIVNTCGFLESAINESIDCVLEIAELKETGQLRKLIVAGCVVSRYRGEIREALPEVDAFVSIDDIVSVGTVARSKTKDLFGEAARPYFLYDESSPRILSTASHTAYVKISEGCNRPCTFCIIPQIRGAFRSRSIDSVCKEVLSLGSQGVREVNLVAQDLTDFGDARNNAGLTQLLEALDDTEAVDWIRLLYAYPLGIDAELLKRIDGLERVCSYLDLPLQHVSSTVLKAMKRPLGKFAPGNLVPWMKEQQPAISLRTTFIVGFPGETEKDVQMLERFIAQGYFSSVGVFTYSPEEGTEAFALSGQVPEEAKEDRRAALMQAQQKVVEKQQAAWVGKTLRVLIDGHHEDTDLLLTARSEYQAPEVDGVVLLNDSKQPLESLVPGSFCNVEITGSAGYDLIATVI